MAVVNTNVNASVAQNAPTRNERAMNTARSVYLLANVSAHLMTSGVGHWVENDLADPRLETVSATLTMRSA